MGFEPRSGFILCAAVTATASAQEFGNSAKSAPPKPGGVRIGMRNPLPGNWVCTGTVCVCKPLACGAAVQVNYSTKQTPARKPDPQALERFAKIEVPKGLRAANASQEVLSDGKNKIELVATRVTKVLNHSAVDIEHKAVIGGRTIYTSSVMIFAGPVLLTVSSHSTDRAAAKKGLNEYLAVMTIEEGPSLAPKPSGEDPSDEPVTVPPLPSPPPA